MALFAWGSNKFGEISDVNESCYWSPQGVNVPDGQLPISISAGEGHSIFATESGDVYTFGRGREGQLGLGHEKRNINAPSLVRELQHESIIKVVAGAISSYAITATGRIYHWGLVHKPGDLTDIDPDESAASGQLTGLAEDQSLVVAIDTEARNDQSYQLSRASHGAGPAQSSRLLRDIVQDSTERWMLANDDADEEYYRELATMGYDKEELDERMQNRGREYHGMMRVQCRREFLTLPAVISSLSHLKIVSIAAGYAHCIVLTEDGRMLSVGYNDRGQLGLGHRISTSEFKPVDYLEGKFVVQVVCGQQHSMCRAIDRNASGGVVLTHDNSTAHQTPCSVYVWGNGMLGQLGLGLKGTSKGRLLPTLLNTLSEQCPLGVIDISAGGNFSVAVSLDGGVYTWGHAEYNQHGTGIVAGQDYVDNFHYFIPRPLAIYSSSGDLARIRQISCGSNFTVAVSEEGDVYSWGWNAYGVLGQGKGFLLHEPTKISTLGRLHVDRTVSEISAGSNHVLAVTQSSGNVWAKSFRPLLKDPVFSDAAIVDETTGTTFPCHRVILAARSTYFRGFLRAAERMRGNDRLRYEGGENPAPAPFPAPGDGAAVTENIYLTTDSANVATIQYLLEYIYTDTLSAPTHRRKQLADLAEFVGISRLAALCRSHLSYSARKRDGIEEDNQVPPSSFESDMLAAVRSTDFADVRFNFSPMSIFNPDESSRTYDIPVYSSPAAHVISAHKVLLSRMPYFHSLFSGQYRDCEVDRNGIIHVDLSGFLEDGIDEDTFDRVLQYSYSGTVSIIKEGVPSDTLMSLIIASNRVGLSQLTQLCEKKLSLHLGDYPENIENCLLFANMYNIPRLSRQCEELLAHKRRLKMGEKVAH